MRLGRAGRLADTEPKQLTTQQEYIGMGSHPLNLALRFLLELAAWAAIGYWGWTQHQGFPRVLLGIGLPLAAMAVWGTFRVQNDPGKAPVEVPGIVRLMIELAEFGAAAWLLAAAGRPSLGIGLAVIVVLHYAISYDRIRWLLTGR
jgi:hypothetical protein